MTRQRMNSSLAVISMVFAVLGWTALPVLGGIVAIISLILGYGVVGLALFLVVLLSLLYGALTLPA